MATVGVLQAQDLHTSFHHEIMEASPVGESHKDRTRHGRSRHGGSIAKSGRARGASLINVNEREVTVSKALTWIFKHGEEQEELVLDSEGFANCEELLSWHHLQTLRVTLQELRAVVAHDPRQRFVLKTASTSTPASLSPADWSIGTTASTTLAKELASMTPITIASENIPETVIYSTTYAAYPLILAAGAVKNTSGTRQLRFSTDASAEDAEVLIYIDVFAALEAAPDMAWFRSESKASVVTDGDAKGAVSRQFWKRVVGRKFEVGVLFEDGEEVKEVPANLRGKKAGKRAERGSRLSMVGVKKEVKELSSDEESV